ncbi:MAG: DUF1800 domain-containing protein [Acidobacteriota bacterium]
MSQNSSRQNIVLSRRQFLAAGGLLMGSAMGCGRLDTLDPAGLLATPWRRPASPVGPFVAPLGDAIDPIRHVLDRLAFGPRPEDYGAVQGLANDPREAAARYVEHQLHPERIEDPLADWAVRRLETLDDPPGLLFEFKPEVLLDELTRGSLLRAVYSRRQLYEVMVHFWSDHFNIDASKGDCKWLKPADDRDVVRRHALGNFSDLLRASALSPAMLWYLDGRVNRRASDDEQPNENYARELLELHTLGVHGGYSQRDVMEIARCLTGWTVLSEDTFGKGEVEFQSHLHDDSAKTVLGREIPAGGGASDLDRVLDIVAHHPSTARHLAIKLCRRFIGEQPDEATVDGVAETFRTSRGDIRETLRTVFASEAFQTSKGRKLKRPFRYLVSALRATGAETDGGERLQRFLLSMGHAPFQYPTPDGYTDDTSPWLGTLLWRWNLAVALADGRLPGTTLDLPRLSADFEGRDNLHRHLLGRRARPEEAVAGGSPAMDIALALASPAFQRH